MELLTRNPRLLPALAVAIPILALGTAFASEAFGLKPCVLCIYQRWAYVGALFAGVLGLLTVARPTLLRLSVVLAGLAFLTGAGIAAFHTGVERKWWAGTAACHAPKIDSATTIEEMKQILLNKDFVACDEIPWSLFGASMANYNLVFSLAVATIFLAAAWDMGQNRLGQNRKAA